MTSMTVHAGAYSPAMPAVITAAVAGSYASGIKTTVTISGAAYTAPESFQPRSINTSAQADSTSHNGGGEDTSMNNENKYEGGSTRPPALLPPWMMDDQPNGWRDKLLDDTFSVANDVDLTTTSSKEVAEAAKTALPPFIANEDGRPGSFPSPLLPLVITSEFPSTTKVFYPGADTDKTATQRLTNEPAPTVGINGIHNDWWQPPSDWSTHIPHTQPETKPFGLLSETTEVVVTVKITESLPSTTVTGTTDILFPGWPTMEPVALARIARPMSTSAVSAQSRAQTNAADSAYLSQAKGGAASLLPAQGPGVVATEAIALLAGFYIWFM